MSAHARTAIAVVTAAVLAGCGGEGAGTAPSEDAVKESAAGEARADAGGESATFAPDVDGFRFEAIGDVTTAAATGMADLTTDSDACAPLMYGLALATPDDPAAFPDDEVVVHGQLASAAPDGGGVGAELITRTFEFDDLAAATAQAVAGARACTAYDAAAPDGPTFRWEDVAAGTVSLPGLAGDAVRVDRTVASVTGPGEDTPQDLGITYVAYLYPYAGTLTRVEVTDQDGIGVDADALAAQVLAQLEEFVA